ncbi:MAG: Flp pilus assembly secretin CpaC [Brevundimonas sp.]
MAGTFVRVASRAPSIKWNPAAMSRSVAIRPLARLAVLAVAVLGLPGIALAQAQPMNVGIDQSTRVQLSGPAGSVIVGNSQIADVTVVDANTLYITGKGYGVTEVIAVDAIGRTVFQSRVVVTAGSGDGQVRIWRGGQATEMACAASCSPSVHSTPTP